MVFFSQRVGVNTDNIKTAPNGAAVCSLAENKSVCF